MKFSTITLTGGAQLENVVIENLATDPASPRLAQIWYNTADGAYKFYDGTEILPFAVGGDLDEYLKRDGSDSGMTGELVLDSNDQSAAVSDRAAVSVGYLNAIADTKEDVITGAASTITSDNLGNSLAVVTDETGKIAESVTTSAEIAHLSGVTSPVQTQIDSKQADLGYDPVDRAGDSMTGNLAMQTNKVIGLGAPTEANDAVRLVDLETAISTLNWQDDVIDVQTDNTLDPGASPASGVRYILTDVANLNANFGTITDVSDGDIVEFDGTEFVVAYDISAEGDDAAGTLTAVQAQGVFFRYTLGSGWGTFTGLEALNAGNGLVKNGNVLDVNMGAGIATLPADEVGVDVDPTLGLYLADPTTGDPSVLADARLGLLLDGTTLATSATGVKVAIDGITEVELASTAFSNGLQGGSGTVLSVLADTGILVTETGVSLDLAFTDARYVDVTGDTLTGPLILSADPSAALEAATKQYVDTAIGELNNDTDAVHTRITQGHFVYDGTASADASHTVTHNIGTKYVNVTVVDATDEVIIPESITFNTDNQLTVTLSEGLAIRVICTGAAPAPVAE